MLQRHEDLIYPIVYAIYGNMDPISMPPMLAYIPYMDPMGTVIRFNCPAICPAMDRCPAMLKRVTVTKYVG